MAEFEGGAAGDRVKLRELFGGDPFGGAVGVIVKVTHGHRCYKVWLDKPVHIRASGRGRGFVGAHDVYAAHCSKWQIEGLTDEGERYVLAPPPWKNTDAFYAQLGTHCFEVVERATGHVVDSSSRGIRRAHAVRERIAFMVGRAERKAAHV